jgi:hypothetical protein
MFLTPASPARNPLTDAFDEELDRRHYRVCQTLPGYNAYWFNTDGIRSVERTFAAPADPDAAGDSGAPCHGRRSVTRLAEPFGDEHARRSRSTCTASSSGLV